MCLQVRDANEGADIIMVKPAMPYLDIISEARTLAPNHPLACYQVSGEYAMVVAGARAGVYDLKTMAFESVEGMLRAGQLHLLDNSGGKLLIKFYCRMHARSYILHARFPRLVIRLNCSTCFEAHLSGVVQIRAGVQFQGMRDNLVLAG
jgi:hypothetical protein